MAVKTCPFCAEDIQEAAIKCKHCGSMLAAAPATEGSGHRGMAPAFDVEEGVAQQSAAAQSGPARSDAAWSNKERRVEPAREASTQPSPRRPGEPAATVIVSGEIGGVAQMGPSPTAAGSNPRADSRTAKARARAADTGASREVLYRGSPSWRAFLRHYFFIAVLGLGGPVLGYVGARSVEAGPKPTIGVVAGPVLVAVVWYLAVGVYRRSRRARLTRAIVEIEAGIVSRKIDVVELWRCRNVVYRQSFFDRVLGIAHFDIATSDPAMPRITVAGVPASRRLFERVRDSIETQREVRNVGGRGD